MKFLSFDGRNLSQGIDLSALSALLLDVAREKPGATLSDLPAGPHILWPRHAGKGQLNIQHPDGTLTSLPVPSEMPICADPGCVIRILPEHGQGYAVAVFENGRYAAAADHAATPPDPLLDTASIAPIRAAARQWLRTGDVGASSATMCRALTGETDPTEDQDSFPHHPRDIDDFRRCLGFLQAVPAARAVLSEVARLSPQWKAIYAAFAELEVLAGRDASTFSKRLDQVLDTRPMPKP